MVNDPIADLLVRIKNAISRKHKNLNIDFSHLKWNILQLLKKEGYLQDIFWNKQKKTILIDLKYVNQKSSITGLRRISKPGLRVYSNYKNLPFVLNGLGIAIVSTSAGILSDKLARKAKLGGEVLAYVW